LVKLAGQIPCKPLKMNNLQHKQLESGQTGLNLVKHGQNKPIRFRRPPFSNIFSCKNQWEAVSLMKVCQKPGRNPVHQGLIFQVGKGTALGLV
jgi:hypothetical protein